MRTNKFITQLQLSYHNIKKQSIVQQASVANQRKSLIFQNQKKQSSKSTYKSKSKRSVDQQSIRRSQRINHQNNHEQLEDFIEIQKQPLWNRKKMSWYEYKNKPKKSLSIEIIKKPIQRKIAAHESLSYEFEGKSYVQPLSKISINMELEEEQDQKIKQNKINDGMVIQEPKPRAKLSQQIFEQRIQKQRQKMQECLEEEDPTYQLSKFEASLLQIQKIIDEFFIFQKTFRPQRTQKLKNIINYVTNIRGYLFDRQIFEALLNKNPNLYTKKNIDGVAYIKCPDLQEIDIMKRQIATRKKMQRESRKAKQSSKLVFSQQM